MPGCQNFSFKNNDAVVSAQVPPDTWLPHKATETCRSRSTRCWTWEDFAGTWRMAGLNYQAQYAQRKLKRCFFFFFFFYIGDMVAVSQHKKCGHEKSNDQLCISWGEKSLAFSAEVLWFGCQAKLPNCKGREALNEKSGVSESLEKRFSITVKANTCQGWSWHQHSSLTM